jgi:CRP-like cAMP-binding protein
MDRGRPATALYDAAQTAIRIARSIQRVATVASSSVAGSGVHRRMPSGVAPVHGERREARSMASERRAGVANRVLASVPLKEYTRLQAQLEPVVLEFKQVLYEPGSAIRHVYFPTDCLVSLLTAVDKRRTLEVGMVGNEGMAGMPFILGMGVSGVRAIVQGRGSALRMGSAAFRVEFDRNRPLQDALYRYTYALMAQISQTAACNRFHEGEARLARWLLMTRDRVASDDFRLTHEFLAHMLGLRREGVTEAASALKQRKLIDYTRGEIRILDVRGLRASSCVCYRIVKSVFDRVQG